MYSLHYEHNIERVWGFHGAAKKNNMYERFYSRDKIATWSLQFLFIPGK
jgi:hypothetical protein